MFVSEEQKYLEKKSNWQIGTLTIQMNYVNKTLGDVENQWHSGVFVLVDMLSMGTMVDNCHKDVIE